MTELSAASKPGGDAKGLGKKLDTDNTTKLDTTHDVQDKPELPTPVKPPVIIDPLTTNVTVKAKALEHMQDGNLAVVTTSAGQLIVPSVGFAKGELPPAFDGDDEQDVVVTGSYARSQSLV